MNHLFAGIAVADYDPALGWYERLFERPPNGVVKHLVDNLDGQSAELAKRGIASGAIEVVPGIMRKPASTDPEVNRISLGEDLS